MAYSINKTDGSILATVADGQIDQFSTDITLIGKNYSGFGEVLNENFVKMLENFADTTSPENPIRGQIWFDVSELKLKVYNGTGFVPVSSATISTSQPLTLGSGDLWFDDLNKQLFFYDGTDTILLGPDYSVSQGLSGIKVVNVLDTLNQNRVISLLYTNGILLGIFSKDSFTPKIQINGFEGAIQPGFNAGTLDGIKFNVTATNSEALGGQPATSYVRNDTDNIIAGQLILASNLGLIVGDANQAQLLVNNGDVLLANIASNKDLTFLVRRGVVAETAIDVVSASREIKLYEGLLDSTVTMGGNLVVEGNLTVNGDVVTVNTSVLTIEDKNIVLASLGDSTAGDEEYADGGGMILRGAVDHEFTYDATARAWYSTEHINLASGYEFKIDGVTVLSGNALGSGITSIPGVTSFGTQTVVNVGPDGGGGPVPYLRLENNKISTLQTNQDLEIEPNGSGDVVLIGSPKIEGLLTTSQGGINQSTQSPTAVDGLGVRYVNDTELSEATNKRYVLNTVRTRSIVLSLDISDGISNSGIATLLSQIAPPAEYENGTIARLLCTFMSASAGSLNINSLVSTTTSTFVTPSGTAPAVIEPVAFATATIPAPSLTPTRLIKTFQIVSGNWTFIS